MFLSIQCHQFYTLDTSVFTTEYVSWHIYTNMQFSMNCFILSSRHLYINIVHKHVHSPTLYTMYNTNNMCTVKIVFQKNLFNKLCAKYMTCLLFSFIWFSFLFFCISNKTTYFSVPTGQVNPRKVKEFLYVVCIFNSYFGVWLRQGREIFFCNCVGTLYLCFAKNKIEWQYSDCRYIFDIFARPSFLDIFFSDSKLYFIYVICFGSCWYWISPLLISL